MQAFYRYHHWYKNLHLNLFDRSKLCDRPNVGVACIAMQ